MIAMRNFLDSLSARSVSTLLAIACIGFLVGCSGDVNSPKVHVSGVGFDFRNPDFSAEKSITIDIPVDTHSSLNIAAINGEVVVTGHHDVDTVAVTANMIVGSDSQADADSHIDDLEIQVVDSGQEIFIETIQPPDADGRKYDVEYDIRVPSSFAVIATQVNGGMDMVDIENSVDVANTNGDVVLFNIVGGVAADVVNGSIAATVTLPVNEAIDLIIDNGSIELRIPRATSAVVSASVDSGSITSSNLTFDDLVQTSQSLTGTLGNGDGVITLAAGNGEISILGSD